MPFQFKPSAAIVVVVNFNASKISQHYFISTLFSKLYFQPTKYKRKKFSSKIWKKIPQNMTNVCWNFKTNRTSRTFLIGKVQVTEKQTTATKRQSKYIEQKNLINGNLPLHVQWLLVFFPSSRIQKNYKPIQFRKITVKEILKSVIRTTNLLLCPYFPKNILYCKENLSFQTVKVWQNKKINKWLLFF